MKKYALLLTLLIPFRVFAQQLFQCQVKDAASQEPIPNVSVLAKGVDPGTVTDNRGQARLRLPAHPVSLVFSCVGYQTYTLELKPPFPVSDSLFIVQLVKEDKEMEEVIVSSSRTESRIENLPTRVEVLGAEEVNEEVGIKPGNLASLLGDIAGIQTQMTSAATGNTEMRVQGLPGKYTQLLRDGMPLFGGYAGSFSVLQIPPLDLKQVEIVKGASSTLYGGGAIAGMINLVSKKPKAGKPEASLLLNQSTLKESNLHAYASGRNKRTGYTFFTGINYQRRVDVNRDGFSDLPDLTAFFLHPTLFLYPGANDMVSVGYNGSFENRKGGDMLVLNGKPDAQHRYFVSNRSSRNNLETNWEHRINTRDRFTLKATGSLLNRSVETAYFGVKAAQFSWFGEANYLRKRTKHDLVLGVNFSGDDFRKKQPDSSLLANGTNATLGVFVQDDWRTGKKTTVESGLRLDHHNRYGSFLLPRISLLYRIGPTLTTRLGGGLGYKIPTVFSSEVDERDYRLLLPVNSIVSVKAERSQGLNWDINFHRRKDGSDWTVNQTFFLTNIQDPIIWRRNNLGQLYLCNEYRPLITYGFETYVQWLQDPLELYFGYTYTVAKKLYDNAQPWLDLSARNKFAAVLAYEFSERFRAGIEASLTGRQYLDDGSRTPAYLFGAAMVRYDIGNVSVVLNCENLLDYRQTKKEAVWSPPAWNPVFRPLWAPIDGRVINLSVRLKR